MAITYITSSGNIISEDYCRMIFEEKRAAWVKDASFGIRRIDEHIAVAFSLLRERWEEIRVHILENRYDTSTLRERWLRPFFEYLDFEPVYQKSHLNSDTGKPFHLSHLGWNDARAPLIHMVGLSQDPDLKDPGNHTHPDRSPHDTLQQFLNSTGHRWAILTNGKKLRLLRDYYHTITKGFLEFDLEKIFEDDSVDDFILLFRLLHKTRFLNQFRQSDEANEESCLLETFYRNSQETGVEIGNHLRDQVKSAIEFLGNGFTEGLPWREMNGAEVKNLYREVMNLIYRLLFLMFAEQKGWLPVRNEVYAKTYSINALRRKAELNSNPDDPHTDLWEGLKITFRMAGKGCTLPGGDTINAFGGQLFSPEKIATIEKLPLKNKYLLGAIFNLCYFEDRRIRYRINYTTLAIDALGSVYESLLDYEPAIASETFTNGNRTLVAGEFYLNSLSSERKTTGSYYTDHRLVSELVRSALIPVIEQAIAGKSTPDDKEKAILSLKICDMACGSGAFLIAALEKTGEYLARIIRNDDEAPTEEQLRKAKHKALLNCIYGVDLNPMAVELAKFSLWITASMPDMPLSFLDHKLRCGNSLVGANDRLVKKGIPVEAFNPHSLDIKEVCSRLKKRVKQELEAMGRVEESGGSYSMGLDVTGEEDIMELRYRILENTQDTPSQVDDAESGYQQLIEEERQYKEFLLADLYTAAFFQVRNEHDPDHYITNRTLQAVRDNQPFPCRDHIMTQVEKLRETYRFFHWELEFPEVFHRADSSPGGFDCILGNPPWERVKLVEKEFFASLTMVSSLPTAARRTEAIARLKETHPAIFQEFLVASNQAETVSVFLRHSGRFPLLGIGDVNTYTVFTENCHDLTGTSGRMGIIVPTGIATDDTTKDFFRNIVETKTLVSLYDFENREGIFPDVHRMFRFCLIILGGSPHAAPFDFLFYATNTGHLADNARHFSLTSAELLTINPNTGNCPVFRNRRDAEIVKKIYRRFPVLINEKTGENPWGIRFYTMFHMANDSGLFRTREELEAEGLTLTGNIFHGDDAKYLPLYEAKMVWQYDHRYGTYEGFDFGNDGSTSLKTPSLAEYRDPDYEPLPRYWVSEADMPMLARAPEFVLKANRRDAPEIMNNMAFRLAIAGWMSGSYLLAGEPAKAEAIWKTIHPVHTGATYNPEALREQAGGFPLTPEELARLEAGFDCAPDILNERRRKWLIGFRDITNATNERTCIATVVPNSAISNKFPLLLFDSDLKPASIFIGMFNSLPFDYIVRQKMAGITLNLFILKQFPTIDFSSISESQLNHIQCIVTKLTCTSKSVQSFNASADEKSYSWDESERFRLKCELDAMYAHLYGLEREELEYILETFPIVKRKDVERYGTYRTKEEILHYFDKGLLT